jgi:hypothetical protein
MLLEIITFNFGSLPEWITAISALIALTGVVIAFIEYHAKTRPYLNIKIETQIDEQKNWNFLATLSNKGKYPVYSKITKALLIIGDEKYPTMINQTFVIFPGGKEEIKAPVGFINELGRKKITQAKFRKNIVKLFTEVSSKKLKQKKFKYKTILKLQILVEGEKPDFILLEKTFI